MRGKGMRLRMRKARTQSLSRLIRATEGGTVAGQQTRTRGIRLTERDRRALRAIAEQGAAYSKTVSQLLAIYGGRQSIGDRATRAVMSRWKSLGLVNAERVFSADPSVVYPTVAGGAFAGIPCNGNLPSVTSLRHTLLTAAVRPFYERRGLEFIPERFITEDGHRPDAIANDVARGLRACVEIELTQKSRDRLAAILRDTTTRFDRVIYWAEPDIGQRVLAVAEQSLTTDAASKVRAQPLPEVRR